MQRMIVMPPIVITPRPGFIAAQRAREEAQRLGEQARERERAAQEARERAAQEARERAARDRAHREYLEIKDKPLESPLIDPIDLFAGGVAARGVRVGSRQGESMLLKIGNWILGKRSTAALSIAAKELVAHCRTASGRVVVNLAGTGEIPGVINVNNLAAQQVKDIPYLLRVAVERVGELFAEGSVDAVVSNNVVHGTVDWVTTAAGCFKILRPGGNVSIAPYAAGNFSKHIDEIVTAFRAAHFRHVYVVNGKFVTAVRP